MSDIVFKKVIKFVPEFAEQTPVWINDCVNIFRIGNGRNVQTLLYVHNQKFAGDNPKPFAKTCAYLREQGFQLKIIVMSSNSINEYQSKAYDFNANKVVAIVINGAPNNMVAALFEYGLLNHIEVKQCYDAFTLPQIVVSHKSGRE